MTKNNLEEKRLVPSVVSEFYDDIYIYIDIQEGKFYCNENFYSMSCFEK